MNRRRGRSYVSISTNYTRACHATNTKRSASKTTEGNASETTKEVQVKPQKEIQVKPQKEVQVKTAKRGAKEQPIQKENQLKTVSDSKPPVIENKTSGKRKYEVFGKCVTAAAATTNKTKRI